MGLPAFSARCRRPRFARANRKPAPLKSWAGLRGKGFRQVGQLRPTRARRKSRPDTLPVSTSYFAENEGRGGA